MPRKIRVGVLSTSLNYSTRVSPEILGSEKVEPVAVASRSLAAARAYADRHQIPRAYGSYQELLADPQIDVVYNALPNGLHAEWVVKTAAAGKHSLCEKPLGDDADQAAAMAATCAEANVLLCEAFMFRFAERNLRARELIAAGEVGRPWRITASFSFNIPRRPRNIRHRPDLAGGALADAGCYTVAACRFLSGQEPVAVLSSMKYDPEFEVDMSGSGILEFPDRSTGLIAYSIEDSATQQIELVGSEGSLFIDQFVVSAREPGAIRLRRHGSNTERIERFPADLVYRAEFDAMADAIQGTAALPFDHADAIAQARVLDALRESAREERKVGLPPQKP